MRPYRFKQITLLTRLAILLLACVALSSVPLTSFAQSSDEEELISLDFADVELPVVIDTISRLTGYNFIYDDRVRGRVTIVSPTEVTIDQAFAVFESVLKVKGFSLVLGPGNTYKILPIRDIKESSVDTIKDNRPSPNRDRFVTRSRSASVHRCRGRSHKRSSHSSRRTRPSSPTTLRTRSSSPTAKAISGVCSRSSRR